MSGGDQARVSVAVAVPPDAAFEIFTTEIDRWWRRGPKFRWSGRNAGLLHLEPHVGGRLFESVDSENGGGPHVFEVGRVLVWEPPARLAFSWRNANFAPDEITQVDVEFVPSRTGTIVTVTHRGWSALPPDHPARHGLHGAAFSRMLGLWWGELLTSLRQSCGTGGLQ